MKKMVKVEEVSKAIDDVWRNRIFITGNSISQYKEEKAFRDGFESAFLKCRKSIKQLVNSPQDAVPTLKDKLPSKSVRNKEEDNTEKRRKPRRRKIRRIRW